MSKKKILMQRFNGTGYDPQYPETHVKNVTGVNQTVANNVGVAATDGATVIGEMSEIDYFVSPQGTTTGTSTAYNLNIGSRYTSLDDMDGVVIRAKFHTTTGDNPTLNVNGLGAKPILAENGANIPYQIGEGVWATLIWSSTLNGWIVQGWGKKKVMKTELITSTSTWTVPDNIDSLLNVRLFGGGGGGGGNGGTGGGGGGGGHMVSKVLTVTPRQVYPIIIGAGGNGGSAGYNSGTAGGNGGATSFGTLASANGGSGGTAGRVSGNTNYAGDGGSGGTGGGGAGAKSANGTVSDGTGGSGSYGGSGGRGLSNSSAAGNGGNGIAAAGGTGAGGAGSGGGGGGGGYGGKGGDGGEPNFGGGGGGGGYGAYGNGGRGGNNTPSPYWGGDGGTAAGGGGGGAAGGTSGIGGKGGDGICILTYWTCDDV